MRRVLAGAAAAVLLATGCAPDTGPDESGRVSPSRVEVDTPQLRALKAEIGIEACRPGAEAGGALPAITLPCLGGGEDVDLSTLRGPMIINLWNFPCGPCREEMPALQEFYEQHGERVPVLGIDSMDVMPLKALELARETGATYPQLADPGGDLWARKPFPTRPAYPYLGFVDASGDIVGGKFGGIDSADDLVALVEQHLGIQL